MLTKIVLVVALCSGVKYQTVQTKIAELQAHNPGSTVTLRVDKKAQCLNGQVLTGKDAKILEELSHN